MLPRSRNLHPALPTDESAEAPLICLKPGWSSRDFRRSFQGLGLRVDGCAAPSFRQCRKGIVKLALARPREKANGLESMSGQPRGVMWM